jgi:hypothetical protein
MNTESIFIFLVNKVNSFTYILISFYTSLASRSRTGVNFRLTYSCKMTNFLTFSACSGFSRTAFISGEMSLTTTSKTGLRFYSGNVIYLRRDLLAPYKGTPSFSPGYLPLPSLGQSVGHLLTSNLYLFPRVTHAVRTTYIYL